MDKKIWLIRKAQATDLVPCPGAKRREDCICKPTAFGFEHQLVTRSAAWAQRIVSHRKHEATLEA